MPSAQLHLTSLLLLLFSWPGLVPVTLVTRIKCAFNAILNSSGLTDPFSPGQMLEFLLGEPGEQHLC